MTALVKVIAGVVVGIAGISAPAAQEKMATYQLVILRLGHAPSAPLHSKFVIKDHGAYVSKLGADGHSMAAGTVLEGAGEIVGLWILKVESADRARELAAADPAVKAGVYIAEVLSFMSRDAGMRPWASGVETVYFGFLDTGPNRGQDAETAKRLQAEHLAYMARSAQAGQPGVCRSVRQRWHSSRARGLPRRVTGRSTKTRRRRSDDQGWSPRRRPLRLASSPGRPPLT
jgi:uncharacterized protein YciI